MENSELQKRVKELRVKQGLSQEDLAEKSGLSLRTIQRIENGESVPRGDTLRRLAIALQSTPDDLIDWQVQEDNNVITMLNLSQLGFLFFPLLGIVIPLAIWILNKEKVKFVDTIGKSILNFQITWSIVLFVIYMMHAIRAFFHIRLASSVSMPSLTSITGGLLIVGALYAYNLIMIVANIIRFNRSRSVRYVPAIGFLD